MSTDPTYEFSPEISLSTALSIAGMDLIEMAGAITECGNASDYKLDRVAKAARKALAAIDDYRNRRDGAHQRLPLAKLDALNGDDSEVA